MTTSKLTKKAFFVPSRKFTFDDSAGTKWVTDSHVLVRADHVRATRIEHDGDFTWPFSGPIVRGPKLDKIGEVHGLDRCEAYIIGSRYVMLHHDPRIWDAWEIYQPHVAISSDSATLMVEWVDDDEQIAGWTALRSMPPGVFNGYKVTP